MGIAAARPVAVETPLGEDALLLVRMQGTEQLGRLFQLDLELFSKDGEIQAEDLLGGNMTVRMELQDGGTRYWNGLVSRFSTAGSNEEFFRYEVTLRPWLWFLTRTADCRIFQEKTAVEIIEQVFGDRGFTDYRLALSGDYEPWEYCVQYRETDFNFVSRLMEHEGLYYFFEHENGKHTLVVSDAYSSHAPFQGYETIPFFLPEEKDLEERDCINEWRVTKSAQSGGVALADFDWVEPKKGLRNTLSTPKQHELAEFEIFDYPGLYKESGPGDTFARIRVEELHSQYETVRGVGNARGIAPGYLTELEGYPRDDQNREYLLLSASYVIQSDEFRGSASPQAEEDLFHVRFTAIESQTPYRSPRITPKPYIRGVQSAIVVGPSGEEIWTDEHGRVKVTFFWDRESVADENSSCWIRVAQISAGKGWGFLTLPRIGHEVIVEFLDGDPDRPIITGRVYNGDNTPAHELPTNQTMSYMKSNSSKGGQGFNEMRFEDKAGEEMIFVHAQKDQEVRVTETRHEFIGMERHLKVGEIKVEDIGGDRSETVGGSHKEAVKADRSLDVTGENKIKVGGTHNLDVTGNVEEKFGADHNEDTTGKITLKAAEIAIEATTGLSLKVGGCHVAVDQSSITIKASGQMEVKCDGMSTLEAGGVMTVKGSMVKIN